MRAEVYPEPGAVLIVSAHTHADAVAPAVVGWQVVHLLAIGEQQEIGGVHAHRSAARAFAKAVFTNIVGWRRLGSTVLVAEIATPVEPRAPAAPPVRRQANGLRLPQWRS